MMRAKTTSKQKRRRKTLPVMGAAGVSLAFAGGASAATAPTAHTSLHSVTPGPGITLAEEEISDVNLGTFYVFDKEDVGSERIQLAQRGCRGCGGCRGCAARGCRACGGCGCRGCAVRAWGCGGCGCSCTTGCRVWIGGVWVWVC